MPTSTNKRRLIQNLFLITVLVGLVSFISFKKSYDNENNTRATLYDTSIGDSVSEIVIHVEGREDILLKSINDQWRIVQPIDLAADTEQIQHLFTLFSEDAETSYDIEGKDLSQFGLDKERLSISFNQVKFIFGQYNPVSQKRYILKADKIYLIPETITGLLQAGVEAFKMKEVHTLSE